MFDLIGSILSHPLIISLIIFYIGKVSVADRFFAKKSIEVKFTSVSYINIIKNKLKESTFLFKRYINTNNKLISNEDDFEDNRKLLEKELLRIGRLLFDDIPILLAKLETEIELNFKDPEDILLCFEEYYDKVVEFLNFYSNISSMEYDKIKDLDSNEELDLSKIKQKESKLIEKIKDKELIWK